MPRDQQCQLIAISRDPESGLPKMESYRRLTDDEFRNYEEAVNRLLELRTVQQTIGSVGASFGDLATDWRRIENSAADLQGDASRQERAKTQLNARLGAFLSSAKAFLDHTRTRLTRTYGDESEILQAFVRATNAEYDGGAAYRICSRLRDFVQHCGMPIRFVGVEGWIENPPDGPRRQRVRINCTATDLLQRFDGWRRVAEDLRRIQGDVPLLLLSEQFLRSLARIHETVLQLEVPYYVAAGQHIVRLLNEVADPGKSGAVAKVGRYEGGRQDITVIDAPMDMLELMGMVRSEESA